MSSALCRGTVFIIEEPHSTDQRSKELARSRALSHASLWSHRRRRERKALKRVATARITSLSPSQRHFCRRSTDEYMEDRSLALSSPTTLLSTWTSSELQHCYRDVDFYVHEVAPQFHLTYKVFDVFDVYERYFLRQIPKLACMTWQCNIAAFRTKLSPGGVYQDQYFQRYGEVLSAFRARMFAEDHAQSIDNEILETMIMLINVSFSGEGSSGGDIHLRRLLVLLKDKRNDVQPREALFLQSLLRQWYSTWNIYRRRTNTPACIENFCHDNTWLEARLDDSTNSSNYLTRGFQNLADAQRLSAPTIRVLVRLISCLLPQQQSATVCNTESFQDFEDACPCLRNKDLTFEKVLCLTVMTYSNLVSSPNGLGCEWTLMFGARRGLLTDAITAWPEPHPAEKKCFIWIIATVALAWCEKPENIPSRTAGIFGSLTRVFGGLCWQEIITTVKDFIWDDRFTSQLFELWSAHRSIVDLRRPSSSQ